MKVNNISFVTGSRADYGIVRNYLCLLEKDEKINLSIIVTGALLSQEFGHQVDLIYKDGFKVEAEIEIPIDPSSNQTVIHSMAVGLDRFGRYFSCNKPDLLIILGDRYEMLPVATAAAMNRIPILHIHGGEATFGNYDEFIRHSISKMSLFHFTVTDEYRNRVIQLGESPDRVFNLGSLGAENCLRIDEKTIPERIKRITDRAFFVVLFHPETLTINSAAEQVAELLEAIDYNSDYKYVFIGSNADTNSNIMRANVKAYVLRHNNCIYYENLPTSEYHYLVKKAKGLIGNSSSGIIEAPSLGTYTINIGNRQDGRIKGDSVMDVKCEFDEISNAIQKVAKKKKRKISNPYYMKNTAINYYHRTIEIINKLNDGINDCPKSFYDLKL